MKVIETTGTIDALHRLILDEQLLVTGSTQVQF